MSTIEQTKELAKVYYEKVLMFNPMASTMFITNKSSLSKVAAYYTALKNGEELLRKWKKKILKEQRKQAKIERNKKRNRRKADRMKRLKVKKIH